MDNAEAAALLKEHLEGYRLRSCADLVTLLGKPQVAEPRGASGATYQLEVEVHWDDRPGGALHVLGSIDDGGWRAVKSLGRLHPGVRRTVRWRVGLPDV